MPELPEVETTRRGVAPHVRGQRIARMVVRERRLRRPMAPGLEEAVTGQRVVDVGRRAKYLIFELERGALVVHLGMSGSLRIVAAAAEPEKHDHFDLCYGAMCLRYRDPRRFGMCLYTAEDPLAHPLLAGLGPEPFDEAFSGDYLYALARGRRGPVKSMIMDGRIVTGVGNIYANEALFRARIHPQRPAGRIGPARYAALADHIKDVLREAVAAGGTTLRDFVSEQGRPGYFRARLDVYDRAGQLCPCGLGPIRHRVIAQRSSYFCRCQR